ncbi:MAG: DUF1304 domain-containing protein [Leptospiraceae bacterium]|nr:DUF1304 domain-containing protein [Leptospiraceae bacterium]
MQVTAKILTVLVALEHLYFLVLEMFLWTTPKGLETFNMTAEYAEQSARLAMNQGLYNGFLAAGLLWAGFLLKDARHSFQTLVFFLACVIIAGVFGGATVHLKIAIIQGVPALLALIMVWLAFRSRTTVS